MSALGHLRPSRPALEPAFVRYAPNSDLSGLGSGRPRSAISRHRMSGEFHLIAVRLDELVGTAGLEPARVMTLPRDFNCFRV
jgi:hypothetical protein